MYTYMCVCARACVWEAKRAVLSLRLPDVRGDTLRCNKIVPNGQRQRRFTGLPCCERKV